MKYIQSASALAQEARAAGKKFPLVRVVKSVIPPGIRVLPLDTLGYYVLLLRHHRRFRVWNTEHLGVAHLSANKLRRHRQILKDAGLMFQTVIRGRTYTTVLRAPVSRAYHAEYQKIYDDLANSYSGPDAANQLFADLAGCLDGPSLILPRDTLVELTRLEVDLKAVGLWAALASQPLRHNWQSVTNIGTALGMTRKTTAQHLTPLQNLGLVKCIDKREIFVNVLIKNELS